MTDEALARQDLCRFLAGCYYEPGAEFAEERLFESIAAAAQRINPELAEHAHRLAAAFATADLQDLLVDYTRLFLGAPQALAKPYASVWLTDDPELMQDSAMELLRLYQQGGFILAVHDHAQTDFYRELAEFTELFVRLEGQRQEAVMRH